MAYRITPSLGPDVGQHETAFYWDFNNKTPAGVQGVSYQLGSRVTGSDGHDYILVKAGADLAADARFNVSETTWVTTANASGVLAAPQAVKADEFFLGKVYAI